jgi:hypothetical protein
MHVVSDRSRGEVAQQLAFRKYSGPSLGFAARRAVHYAEGDIADYGLGWMRRLFHVALEAAR